MFQYMVYINLMLGFFNLLPVYPLDGGQIVLNILPYKYREVYEKILPYGMYIVIFLVVSGLIKFWIIFPTNLMIKFYNSIGLVI